jgi:hypothetical protein
MVSETPDFVVFNGSAACRSCAPAGKSFLFGA